MIFVKHFACLQSSVADRWPLHYVTREAMLCRITNTTYTSNTLLIMKSLIYSCSVWCKHTRTLLNIPLFKERWKKGLKTNSCTHADLSHHTVKTFHIHLPLLLTHKIVVIPLLMAVQTCLSANLRWRLGWGRKTNFSPSCSHPPGVGGKGEWISNPWKQQTPILLVKVVFTILANFLKTQHSQLDAC